MSTEYAVDSVTGEHWRFSTVVNPHDSTDVTIYRGRKYQLNPDWAGDTWQHYWDGDLMVAVYDHSGYTSPTEGEWTERAERCMERCREYDQDLDAALKRLARRLEGNWDADFFSVNIDRGVSLYVYSWQGENIEWRDEIEAVNNGDIWRCEVEEWDGDTFRLTDELFEEWYGEDKADEGWKKEFPLAEFPAELLIAVSA